MTEKIENYLCDFRNSLNDNTAALIRIEERLKNFVEKVKGHEKELEDVKRHVHTVRAVAKVFTIALGVIVTLTCAAIGIWKS